MGHPAWMRKRKIVLTIIDNVIYLKVVLFLGEGMRYTKTYLQTGEQDEYFLWNPAFGVGSCISVDSVCGRFPVSHPVSAQKRFQED